MAPRGDQGQVGRGGTAAPRVFAFASTLRHFTRHLSGSGDTCELEKLREDNSLKDCLEERENTTLSDTDFG